MIRRIFIFITLSISLNLFSQGIITRIAGDAAGLGGFSGNGGPAVSCQLESPQSVTTDSTGNIYIADALDVYPNIRMIDKSTGIITTIAGGGSVQPTISGDTATKVNLPNIHCVISDKKGNLYMTGESIVLKMDKQTSILSIIAGTYLASGYSGDSGPATSALLNYAIALGLDEVRNYLYIADASNNRIRKLDLLSGIITTVVGTGTAGYSGDFGYANLAQISYPSGIAIDSSGNIYFSDNNFYIRKVNYTTGIIEGFGGNVGPYSGDGGAAVTSSFGIPEGLAFDKQYANLYVADVYDHIAIKVDMVNSYTVSMIAGSGTPGFSGDGGPATLAKLKNPRDIALNQNGDLIIADTDNNVVRQVAFGSGVDEEVEITATIFPNPASDFLKIETILPYYEFVLFDLLGNELVGQKGSQNSVIEVSKIPNGIYMGEITSPKGRSTKKIIIQH